jgi:uncharacterized protein YodC (DUF2158 family)
MAFAPGDVVFLKSGGSPMTVTAVGEDSVDCLWLGEEGELFRESIPSVALMIGSDPSTKTRMTRTTRTSLGMTRRTARKPTKARSNRQGPSARRAEDFFPLALQPTLNA